MNKQEQRIIEAARQVLSDWLGGDLTANVSEDFYELESALRDYGTQSAMDFDWQSFRNQAVKDILCVVLEKAISSGNLSSIIHYPELIHECIVISDELIKQLKEKEEK